MARHVKKRIELVVEGMTCHDCATTVERALRAVDGVDGAGVTFETGRATVSASEEVAADALVQAVDAAGYSASLATPPNESSREAAGRLARAHSGQPDLVVLGGGSAGFAAAIRAAELGARVTLIEGGALGGTCVNVGCVPSKTLLRAAEIQHRAGHHPFAGVRTAVHPPDITAVMAQKDALVATLRQEKYWDVLAALPSVTLREGRGVVNADLSVRIDGEVLKPGRLIVTTGASAWAPPIPGLADSSYLTSTDALALADRPASMIVIGGSAVGLEIAQLYARLGTRVTVLELMPALVPSEDPEIGTALAAYLRDEGLDVQTGVSIHRVEREEAAYTVGVTMNGSPTVFTGQQLLVATGRRANTRGFGLETAGIALGPKGEIRVNEHLQTSRLEVYAAGDVIGDPMFVYVAAYGGYLAAENALNGDARRYDLAALPRVTFTDPQVASVGIAEDEARKQGLDVAVSKLPLSYVPRALAARETRGFIKLVADRRTNRLLGAHILATEAGEMVQEPTLAIKHGITIDELASAFHPYLTLAEGIKLAAQAFTKDIKKLSCCAA